jgi:hypothetical protein
MENCPMALTPTQGQGRRLESEKVQAREVRKHPQNLYAYRTQCTI